MKLLMEDYPRFLLEFQRLFPDEVACARHIERIRWPEGFKCPDCVEIGEAWRHRASFSIVWKVGLFFAPAVGIFAHLYAYRLDLLFFRVQQQHLGFRQKAPRQHGPHPLDVSAVDVLNFQIIDHSPKRVTVHDGQDGPLYQLRLFDFLVFSGFSQNFLAQCGDAVPLLGASRFIGNGHFNAACLERRI